MRSIKLFLCISLMCGVFSFLPLLYLSLNPFLMQFYTYTYTNTVDKTYMFLLCNGLLALIALNSALFNDSSSSPQTIEKSSPVELKVSHIAVAAPNVGETEPPHPQEEEEEEEGEEEEEEKSLMKAEQENNNAHSDTQEDHEEQRHAIVMKAEQENNNVLSDMHEDHEEERNAIVSVIDEDEQEYGADETEELNKKCEEFIRRMKAAIRADHRSLYLHNQKSLVALVN